MEVKTVTTMVAVFITACLCLFGQHDVQAQSIERPYVRTNLTLRLVIRYPETGLTNHSLSTDLYIVGNGLGLAWNGPQLLTKSSTPDTWSIDLKFSGFSDGYTCSECIYQSILPVNGHLEYRILTSNMTDMVGPNFGTPIHTLSKLESNFPVREHFSFPYFFTRTGTVRATRVESLVNPLVGIRNWGYYLPPSFNENPYKTYRTFLVPDLSPVYMEAFRFQLEDILVTMAIAEEIVLIGSEDYDIPDQDGRVAFLTPTPGINWVCKTGDFTDNCGGCLPANLTGRDWVEYMRDVCGYPTVYGGHGEGYIDYMVDEVLPVMQTLTKNRLRLSRDNLGIGGCSLGGLISCHAIWTRPNTFGLGWCKSSSFWWPTDANANNGFYFLNHTLKETNLGPRAPQLVYIDVSDGEDDPYYAQLGAALLVADIMAANSPQFRNDETLWLTVVNGQKHSSWNCLTRSWNSLSLLSPPSGNPKNPNPPM